MTRICRFRIANRFVTSITRVWASGATSRCRLCSECVAQDDLCVIQISSRGILSEAQAELFDTTGLRRQAPPER